MPTWMTPRPARMAKETLEGNLRGVLATLTPEEVNADKIKFAQSLLTEAEDDRRHIGLELDTLKIHDVSDEVSYPDSIGRRQSVTCTLGAPCRTDSVSTN